MPPVSKIAQLPDDIRTWLHNLFVERAFGDIEAVTAELQSMLQSAGIAMYIGKSAVGAESLKVKRAQESMRNTTQLMAHFADSSPDEMDKRGEALNALLSVEVFNTIIQAREEAEEDAASRIALLNKGSLAAARLTTTSVRQRQHRHEVEQRAKAAADKVAKIAKKGGLDAATVAEIRASILGVALRAPPPPPAAAPGA